MPKSQSHRASLIAGMVAVIIFVGAVASNLIASDLQPILLQHYRGWVWLTGAIALAVAVATAIGDRNAEKVRAKLAEWREQTNT